MQFIEVEGGKFVNLAHVSEIRDHGKGAGADGGTIVLVRGPDELFVHGSLAKTAREVIKKACPHLNL